MEKFWLGKLIEINGLGIHFLNNKEEKLRESDREMERDRQGKGQIEMNR